MKTLYFALLCIILTTQWSFSQQETPYFSPANANSHVVNEQKFIDCSDCPLYSVNDNSLYNYLLTAPHIDQIKTIENEGLVLEIPNLEGKMIRYTIAKYDMVEKGLYQQFPQIMTFIGIGSDGSRLRADYTTLGFRAWSTGIGNDFMLEPLTLSNKNIRIVYSGKLNRENTQTDHVACTAESLHKFPPTSTQNIASQPKISSGISTVTQLKTYRIAVSTNFQYNNYYGSISNALSGIVTTLNRVNQVYEVDIATRLTLISNSTQIMFSSQAPYNVPPSNLLNAIQTTINNSIGAANYDIGHLFTVSGGGQADVAVACNNTSKARGFSGINPPVGDFFNISFVAHEIGHQIGATHSFNSSAGICGSDRFAATAFEIGSGSTIMSYAGSCQGSNIQGFNDPYFHLCNINQIYTYTRVNFGSTCGLNTITNNNKPSVITTDSFSIPPSTPFALTAIGSDPDPNDIITYCWEQFNFGPASSSNVPVNPNSPRFRSYVPTTNPTRYFPALDTLLANAVSNSEFLPNQPTILDFKVTVRDNKLNGGGIDSANVAVQVVSGTPFSITYPNDNQTIWDGLTSQIVTWTVGNTNQAPINCLEVQILLSSDGGKTWPFVLKNSTPNDGIDTIQVPLVNSRRCRVMVKSIDNIFFDVSNFNFRIRRTTVPHYDVIALNDTQYVCNGDSTRCPILIESYFNYNAPVVLSITNTSPGVFARVEDSTLVPGDTAFVWIRTTTNTPIKTYVVGIKTVSTVGTIGYSLYVKNNNTSPPQVSTVLSTYISNTTNKPIFEWLKIPNADYYELELRLAGASTPLVVYSKIRKNFFQVKSPLISNNINYEIRVRAINSCGVGPWSSTYSFSSFITNCFTLKDTTTKVIPGLGSVSYIFDVPYSFSSISIKNISGVHQRFSDLKFEFQELASWAVPALLRGQSCTSDSTYFNLSFLPYAPLNIWSCNLEDSVIGLPQGLNNLLNFGSCNRYELKISDLVTGSSGIAYGAELEVCHTDYQPPFLTIDTLLPIPQVCIGDSVTLECAITNPGLDRVSYNWLKNGTPITDTVYFKIIVDNFDTLRLTIPNVASGDAGSYQLIQLGCRNKDTTNAVSLQIAPLPTTPTLSLVGDTLFSSTIANNIWSLNGNVLTGLTGRYILIQDTGTYSVIHVQNGCESMPASLSITGFNDELKNRLYIRVYPNPFKNEVFIDFDPESFSTNRQFLTAELTDHTGRTLPIHQTTRQEGSLTLQVDDLSSGLYFLILRDGFGQSVYKLVHHQ
jgi:hypothetical protein